VTAIPLTLTVRMGPGPALAAVVAGVLLGQLYKWAQGSGAARVQMPQRYYQVAGAVAGRLAARDQDALAPAMERARQLIYDGKTADAEALLVKLESRADALARVDSIERVVSNWPPSNEKTSAMQLIKTARDAVAAENDAAAAEALQKLKAIFASPPTAGLADGAAGAMTGSARLAQDFADEAAGSLNRAGAAKGGSSLFPLLALVAGAGVGDKNRVRHLDPAARVLGHPRDDPRGAGDADVLRQRRVRVRPGGQRRGRAGLRLQR
jgi:hypothetical protein